MSKEKLVWGAVILIILISSLYWFYSLRRTEVVKDQDIATTTTEEVKFDVETKTIKEEGEKFVIDIKYPVLVGSSTSLDRINAKIESEIASISSAFKANNNEFDSTFIPQGAKSGLYIEYEPVVEGRGLIGIPLLVSEYIAGAAHPNSFIRTYNFSTSNGNSVELKDLFSSGNYLTELSTKSRAALLAANPNEQYVPEDGQFFEEGFLPKEENFREFLVDGEDLIIIFNPYQVASYAAGILKAKIPSAELSGLKI